VGAVYSQDTIVIRQDSLSIPTAETPVVIKKGTTSIYDRPYSFGENHLNYRQLGNNTLLMIGGCVAGAAILFVAPESVSHWDKDEILSHAFFDQWWDNVSHGPVYDSDDFFLNYVTHPYYGAAYYMGARSAGASAPYAFLYSALASTFFWEYGIEAFAEVPSQQDLIITPIIGSVLGEAFYLAKRAIVANDYRVLKSKFVGHTIVFVLDPLNEINNVLNKALFKKASLSMSSSPIMLPSGQVTYQVALNLTF
jgi:hypothetical protein